MVESSNYDTDSSLDADKASRGGLLFTITLILAAAALCISSYLAYQSIVKGQTPPGCGADSGCASVLASKWSRWMGIPVSALASGCYLMIIIGLVLTRKGSTGLARFGWFVSVMLSVAVMGSAVWFIYLQLGPLDAICPYCMADHALGISVASLILVQAPWGKRSGAQLSIVPATVSVILGLGTVAGLAIMQNSSTAPTQQITDLPTDRDSDLGKGAARRIGLLGGKLRLAPHQEPIIGMPDAPKLIAVMLDYACPHCRHTHEVLLQLKDTMKDDLAIIALPVPMNQKCNPHAPDAERMGERFKNSCELARIALATHLADRSKYAELDRWLYEPAQPRTPDQAKAKAKELVGVKPFEQALNDPRIDQKIKRNIEAYGRDSGADRVPVTMVVGSAPLVGRVEDLAALELLLKPEKVDETRP